MDNEANLKYLLKLETEHRSLFRSILRISLAFERGIYRRIKNYQFQIFLFIKFPRNNRSRSV